MKKNIKKMNKKNETKSKEVVLRSIRMKNADPLWIIAIINKITERGRLRDRHVAECEQRHEQD